MKTNLLKTALALGLMLGTLSAFGEANYVYHERTTANPGGGGQYVTRLNPTSAETYPLLYKVEFQFYTTTARVYYTTDGSTPAGSFGTPSGTTAVLASSYIYTFGFPVVDVVSNTIPAQPAGTVVKYIVSAWHSSGGAEVFGNGPGTPCACGSPTTNSSLATVQQYTVASTTNLYWDSNGTTAGAGALPVGSWGSSTFWSSTFDGSSATAAWTSGRNAIFSAGTDATASNNIPLVGNQTAGALTIEEGHISLLVSNAVVLGTGAVNINNGATLTVDTSARFSQAVGATWNFNGGTLRNQNPSAAGSFVPVAASVVLGAGGATFEQPVTNILSIIESSNVISGVGGITKTGIGVLAFAGTNTYTGPTIINDGELRMRTVGQNRLPTNTAVTIGSTGILNLNGVPTTIGSLSGSGRVGFSATTLAINGTADTIFSGTLTNQSNYGASGAASGAGRISKGSTGTLTLTGTNSITGSITNLAGSLNVATNAVLCDLTCDITVQGGSLNFSNAAQNILSLRGTNNGNVNLGPGHTLMIGGSSTHTFSGFITGPGTLVRTNLSGAWILTNAASPSTYTGQTQIRGGIIQVSSSTALGATNGNTDISTGGELRFDGGFTTFSFSEPLSIAGPGATGGGAIAIQNSAAPTLTGPITVTGDSYISVSSSASGTFTGNITATANQNLFLAGGANAAGTKLISGNINLGSGGITKTNTGVWILSGINTYSGPTVVLQGTLTIGGAGQLGSGAYAANITNSSTFIYNSTAAQTLSGVITGTGSLTQKGSGTLTLSGANNYTGTTAVSNSTLLVHGSLAAGSAVSVANSGILGGTGTISGTVTVTGSGIIAPGASIGTLTLGSAPSLGGTIIAEINRNGGSPLADKLNCTGGVTLGGALIVSNIGLAAQNGDTFDLFDGAVSGVFSSVTVPAGGLAHWKTNNLVVDGSITFTNNAPVATNLTLGVVQGGSVSFPVIGSKYAPTDADGDSLSITAVTAASPGGTSGFTSSNVTYTASGSTGTNTFTYTVSDGAGGTDTKTVTAIVSDPVGFNLLAATSGGGNAYLQYLGIPGTNYALDVTHNLPATNWTPVISNTAGGDGRLYFTNVISLVPTNDYYRTRYVP